MKKITLILYLLTGTLLYAEECLEQSDIVSSIINIDNNIGNVILKSKKGKVFYKVKFLNFIDVEKRVIYKDLDFDGKNEILVNISLNEKLEEYQIFTIGCYKLIPFSPSRLYHFELKKDDKKIIEYSHSKDGYKSIIKTYRLHPLGGYYIQKKDILKINDNWNTSILVLKENIDVARQLLREKHINFLKKSISSLNKNKQKEICKKILKIEIDEFLKYPKSEHTFFENPKVFSSFLQLSKIPKDDILLVSLLTHASGLFKVNVVKALIDYGVVVNKKDEKNVTPLLGLFIYTPTVDKITTLDNNSFDADFIEANILLTWYLQKYKGSKQRKEQVFTQEQERVFRLNIEKKREIYYMLIKAGADDNRTKVNNKTVYNFFKKYKG